MNKLYLIYILTLNVYCTEILNSLNNNHNSVITIVKEVLGKDAQESIVEKLTDEILEHFLTMDIKLDKLLKNQEFVNNIIRQINEANKNNISIKEQLSKSEEEKEKLLSELNQLKLKLKDVDFIKVLKEANSALRNYDSKRYRKILFEYSENIKNKKLIKNLATTYYLSAKSYLNDYKYEEAKKEIDKAIMLDTKNEKYIRLDVDIMRIRLFILLGRAMIKELLNKSLFELH